MIVLHVLIEGWTMINRLNSNLDQLISKINVKCFKIIVAFTLDENNIIFYLSSSIYVYTWIQFLCMVTLTAANNVWFRYKQKRKEKILLPYGDDLSKHYIMYLW